ncbi:hypothetical protein PLESTB_000731200 [Pleodorina starrii]|uniref:Uncharacterized protein n=1 Tax=Pleodorina starrii TaxID=330485 RepID=A0A9W6BJK3_9CHLO|nr:hypothetical protein PLESTM_000192700 [Pleodorina starrii]GLC53314.1 hypothetical protein PLESTB_000731200 [Pleodorina starrii]GLC67217.1 hypothetical protein PLESTF_000530100 [Pleodorina starrii]
MSSSVHEYLTNVLSQRGPSAVPYDEKVKWNIRDHVFELLKVYPTLKSELSDYHSNDGRHLHVLKVDGTVPIHYQGSKYNIPILMWLTERYPYDPPQVFVVPTANMIIRTSDNVNASGQVYTQPLRSWLFPSSNLVDFVLDMSQLFGAEPPLYTRQAGYTPPPTSHGPSVAQPPPNYPRSHAGPSANPSPAASSAGAAASGTGGYASMHYPGIQGSTVGTLTPYVTPSIGNTPSSTPGAAPGPGSTGPVGWGGATTAAAGPSSAYTSASGAAQPPPPPPPAPAFGLGSMFGGFGGFFGGGGQQQQQQQPQQQTVPPRPPPPPPPPSQPSGPPTNPFAGSPSVSQQPPTNPFAAPPPVSQQPPPPPPPPPPPAEPQRPRVSKQELDVHFRHLAIEALAAQLRQLQCGFSEYAEEETVKALEVQNQLNERKAQLQAVHDSLTNERMSTEQLVAELASKTKALQAWLDRNEPIAEKYDPEANPVSSHLLPADGLCRQGMETQARDLALEDAILALDKLLQTGQVPLDAYLKQVRSLCRKQFFSRALGLKVATIQQQGGAGSGGARPSPGLHASTTPYPIAHGDGWSHGTPPPPTTGMQTPGPLLLQPGLAPRYQGSATPGFMAPSTGMLTNPLAGR